MSDTMLALTWLPLDTWIVATAALCASACALLGVFLVLRKMSMMGDAISHAVLPGLAAAFLLTGNRGSLTMLMGAAVVGVLTAVFTEWIRSTGKVDEGASMGVVFTVLFAIGLILIVRAADHVDLDPGCVLYGAIELVPLDLVRVLGLDVPRAALTVGAALLVDLAFVVLCYKELKISTFDPALATTLGINAKLMHYMLMTLVAVTTVAAFESVGSILVIAMLIVPAATAHMLSDRLIGVLLIAVAVAVAAAVSGHVAAIVVPGWIGFPGVSTSTSGMMAVCAGLMFVAAMFLGPRHGVISRLVHQAALSIRVVREDVLGRLFRAEERGTSAAIGAAEIRASLAGAGPVLGRLAMALLKRDGLLAGEGRGYRLTAQGRAAAQQLIRAHRLWETYLDRNLDLPVDHLHAPAEVLEHVTTPAMQERLSESVGHPARDPQGREIPPG